MITKLYRVLIAFVLTGCLIIQSAHGQVKPIYDMGAIGLGQALKRLRTTARVMHTGAHPDDEDSGLLAYLARKEQARAAYFSLTRGDGGQNVIGDELFESLGVLRTEELLQARRLDGGQQFFSRLMDYGFSKKREEAERIWGPTDGLQDMVRAIRAFRPLVVISRFSGTPADGHGQHQFAGYLTPLAITSAADPNAFPEQLAQGLRPWQVRKFYVGQGFGASGGTESVLLLNTGQYDPLIGRSYFEIAMQGRSQHKSQEMGLLELRGKQVSGERLISSTVGTAANETSVFDGIDTSITGIAVLTANTDQSFIEMLKRLQDIADKAERDYDPNSPERLIPILASGLELTRTAAAATNNVDSKFFLKQKEEDFSQALQMSSGIVVDALSNSETIVPGDSLDVAVRVFAAEGSPVKLVRSSIAAPIGWNSVSSQPPAAATSSGFRPRREESLYSSFFTIQSAKDARPTQPYWLEQPRTNHTFTWNADEPSKTLPFAASVLTAMVVLDIGGREVIIERPVEYRYADAIRGEIRREVNVLPGITIAPSSDILIAPTNSKTHSHSITLTLTSHSGRKLSGVATIDVPQGWMLSPKSQMFVLNGKEQKLPLTYELTVPANLDPGSFTLTPHADVEGNRYGQQIETIAYPHVQTHRLYRPAAIDAKAFDLNIQAAEIGYIMGSGDNVPEAIARMGFDIALLDAKKLENGDLSRFKAIVVGIKAYQVRPDLIANNSRILDFVENGGTLLVQYQPQEYARGSLAPFPFKMDSNIRVVDEKAPVRILQPTHPIFNSPNKITDMDFEGWVQERNLWCFTEFDPKYTPLLESHDEGEAESLGGMVVAGYGKGTYIYSSYSWFRQLPAGNPGAYRLFANMLSVSGQ